MKADVPLSVAMLAWNARANGGGAIVVPHPDKAGAASDFDSAVGACFADPFGRGGDRDWPRMTAAEQMQHLMAFAWRAVMRDGVEPAEMHAALIIIPEFRALMPFDMLPDEYREDDGG